MSSNAHHTTNTNKRTSYGFSTIKSQNLMATQNSQTWPTSLPQGWKREECTRPLGLGTGKSDVIYIGPQNQVVRTKPEMQAILGDKYDLALFDWRLGKFQTSQKSKRSEEVSDASNAKVMRMDNMLTFPTRRSAPHLGDVKPVIVRSHPDCKRTDSKTVNQEGPHQLFWEKRLANSVAIDAETGEPFKTLNLPKGIESAGVPGYQSPQLIQSLVHALATKTGPITGQDQLPAAVEKNPCVVINHLQPMIKTFIVTDEDIRRQEIRVKELRLKLEGVRKKLHPRYATERQG